jgi:transcriptional regulator with XRE-family HTH domain
MATLQKLRELAMLSQKELAERLGVTKQAVWEWEHGKAKPIPAHRRNMVRILGISVERLLEAIEETDRQFNRELAAAS